MCWSGKIRGSFRKKEVRTYESNVRWALAKKVQYAYDKYICCKPELLLQKHDVVLHLIAIKKK